jgi:hypothetical protein
MQAIQREIPRRIINSDIAEQTTRVNPLLTRLEMLKRLSCFENEMLKTIWAMHNEVKFIEHLPGCHICKIELELDVERYLGKHSPWWLSLELSPYMEKEFRSAPKEKYYHIGSYWEEVKHYEKYGNTDTGANTIEFILDRAKWAYKHIGKQIRIARRLLRIAKNWNFSPEQTEEFEKLDNKRDFYYF